VIGQPLDRVRPERVVPRTARHIGKGVLSRPATHDRDSRRETVDMATQEEERKSIPGTVIFDGREAIKGYRLNKMCYSFNEECNREAFLADEDAYCDRFSLNREQREAIRKRDVLALLETGGNIYYLAKFTGIFGLNVQDVGAQQTGMSLEDFNKMLVAAGE